MKFLGILVLKIIYKIYEDKINKYCMENKKIIKPKIKSILKKLEY